MTRKKTLGLANMPQRLALALLAARALAAAPAPGILGLSGLPASPQLLRLEPDGSVAPVANASGGIPAEQVAMGLGAVDSAGATYFIIGLNSSLGASTVVGVSAASGAVTSACASPFQWTGAGETVAFAGAPRHQLLVGGHDPASGARRLGSLNASTCAFELLATLPQGLVSWPADVSAYSPATDEIVVLFAADEGQTRAQLVSVPLGGGGGDVRLWPSSSDSPCAAVETLSFDAATGLLFAIGRLAAGSGATRRLLSLDPAALSCTALGEIGPAPGFGDMLAGESAFDPAARAIFWIAQAGGADDDAPFFLVRTPVDSGGASTAAPLQGCEGMFAFACPWQIGFLAPAAPAPARAAAPAGGEAFCGETAVRGMDNVVRLACNTPGDVISAISFAAFGTPFSGASAGPCANWSASPACDVGANASRFVAAACVGKPQCGIPSADFLFDGGVDPCQGKGKWLAIAAECAAGGGTANGGASCAINGTACPLPLGWTQYNLTMSTIVEPGGDVAPGYFSFPAERPFGLVSLDWSVANTIWHHDNQSESTVEATLTENCRRIKLVSPQTRCLMYHNFELALQAFESQREVMYDPSKADWFVRVNGDGGIYNEPGGPGDQYFFDFRNPAVADWYIATALRLCDNDYVDGIFTDDLEGFPSEHDYAPINSNTSYEDVAALQFASLAAHGRLVAALAAHGKYNFQAMGAGYQGEYVGAGVPHDAAGCAAFMRARCAPAWQQRATTMQFDSGAANQSVAAFLVTRGPVAFLGSGWESGNDSFNSAFLFDVGEPQGPCAEAPAGVFSRPWSFGTASLDCNSFAASVPAR